MSSITKSEKKEKVNIAGIHSRSERETELSIIFAKCLDTYCLIRASLETTPISAMQYDEAESSRPLRWELRADYITDCEHAAREALNDLPQFHDVFDAIITEALSGDIDKTIKLDDRSKIVLKVGAVWKSRDLLPRLYFKHIRRRQGEQL